MLYSAQGKSLEPDVVQKLWDELDALTERWGPDNTKTLATAHQPATAMWRANEVQEALDILNQVLICIESSHGREHPMHADVLCTLGQILFELQDFDRAYIVLKEVLETRVSQYGTTDLCSIAAKNDVVATLFELDRANEALLLLQDAYQTAVSHLGRTHALTSVLAWNQVVYFESSGDPEAARDVLVSELKWLLADDPTHLEPHQNAIREMVAERLNWARASIC